MMNYFWLLIDEVNKKVGIQANQSLWTDLMCKRKYPSFSFRFNTFRVFIPSYNVDACDKIDKGKSAYK